MYKRQLEQPGEQVRVVLTIDAQTYALLGVALGGAVFVAMGLLGGSNHWPDWTPPNVHAGFPTGPFVTSLFFIAFAFSGWNAAAYSAEEFQQPRRDVPRAMALGCLMVAAFYLREYAKQGPVVSAVRIAVNNLAGVPSIVYGVFGLGFFIYFLGGSIDMPRRISPQGVEFGPERLARGP